jgi:hypothetical protein
MDKHEYLNNASDYRDYRHRREFLRHGDPDEIAAELEPVGHAKIFGKEGGGVVIEHIYDDGSSEEHHFGPNKHAEACDHLYRLISNDFAGKEEPSKGEPSNEKY